MLLNTASQLEAIALPLLVAAEQIATPELLLAAPVSGVELPSKPRLRSNPLSLTRASAVVSRGGRPRGGRRREARRPRQRHCSIPPGQHHAAAGMPLSWSDIQKSQGNWFGELVQHIQPMNKRRNNGTIYYCLGIFGFKIRMS